MRYSEWRNYDGILIDEGYLEWLAPERDDQAALAAAGYTPGNFEDGVAPEETPNTLDDIKDVLGGDEDAARDVSSRIDELAPGADTVDVIRMLYYQPSTENTPGYWGEVPLFRVEVDGEDRFIDRTGAYYSDLYDFRRHNEMLAEDGTLIAPKDLSSDAGEVELISTSGRHVTGWEKAEPWVMSGAIVLGVGLTMTGVGAPIGLGMIAGGVGYTTADAVANFRERSAHGQSNSWPIPPPGLTI